MSGGRSYRLNWTDVSPTRATFGDWSVNGDEYAGSRHPFTVYFKDVKQLRAHGLYTGYQRFTSMDAAKRWVERRLAKRGRRG